MNLKTVNDLLNTIDLTTRQVDVQDSKLSEHTGNIRTCVEAIRAEVNPSGDADALRTREQSAAIKQGESPGGIQPPFETTGQAAAYVRNPSSDLEPTDLELQPEERGMTDENAMDGEQVCIQSRTKSKFHRFSCSWVTNYPSIERVNFKSRREAIAAGYSPCRTCSP